MKAVMDICGRIVVLDPEKRSLRAARRRSNQTNWRREEP
jgi:hypothetical protein